MIGVRCDGTTVLRALSGFERMKKRPKGYLRKAIVIIADNPLLKMAVAGGNLLAAISLMATRKWSFLGHPCSDATTLPDATK